MDDDVYLEAVSPTTARPGRTPVPPWSRDKLSLLGKYLRAYSVIMRKQRETWLAQYSYVDAFAGEGEWVDRETAAYIEGSPLVALRCDPPFDSYAFIEQRKGRLEHLESVVAREFPKTQAVIIPGDANTVLRSRVIPRVTLASKRRALVFLDPYGLEVDFGTVAELGEAGTFDVFINFSVMGVTRLLNREQLPSAQHIAVLDRVMGDTSWIDRIYQTQTSMFDEHRTYRAPIDPRKLADLYIAKLRSHFKHISEPLLMRNSKGSALYVLFLASQNSTGARIVNETFTRFEKLRSAAP